MNDIKIWVNGEPDVVEKDSTLLELSKRYQEKFKQKKHDYIKFSKITNVNK